ncbi:nuclear transport factor 2 family protein [Sphingomonas sp. Sphisp140]|uniref:nuclear transport factor 2 family protein n=1 Tax=unclassified Sphingomonas TaxID=196159 RepID=UPI0039AEF7D8
MKSRYLSALLIAAAGLSGAVSLSSIPVLAQERAAAVEERGPAATRTAVIAAIDAYRTAVVKGDRAGLDAAFHPDLSYGHTDGAVLGKAEQIDRTLAPGKRFTAVDIADASVRSYGNVAYVTASWTFHLSKDDGTTSTARLSGLDVWTKGPRGWQLIARQLTRPAQ